MATRSSGSPCRRAVEKMRGPVGSDLKITIRREGRETVSTSPSPAPSSRSRRCASRLEGEIGYLRITSFNERTDSGVNKAMEAFHKELDDKLRASFSTCATTRAASWTKPSPSPTPFWIRARSSPPAAARPGHPALQCPPGRPGQGAAPGGADQRRLGVGVRDRRRGPSGSPPRHRSRHQVLWQGLGADHHPRCPATAPCV